MKNGEHHPLEGRDPRDLTDDQWRVLIDYRMRKIEDRVDGLFKAMWTIAGTVIAGVIVFLVTSRPSVARSALTLLGLG